LQVTTLGYSAMELRGAPRTHDITEARAETILNAKTLDEQGALQRKNVTVNLNTPRRQ
jgi:hypothetical protein